GAGPEAEAGVAVVVTRRVTRRCRRRCRASRRAERTSDSAACRYGDSGDRLRRCNRQGRHRRAHRQTRSQASVRRSIPRSRRRRRGPGRRPARRLDTRGAPTSGHATTDGFSPRAHVAGVPSGTMGTSVDRERLRSLVEPHWRRLYNFVFRLTLDRDRAERSLMDVFTTAVQQLDRAPDVGVEIWLLGIANKLLEERLPRQPEVDFDMLDETLR